MLQDVNQFVSMNHAGVRLIEFRQLWEQLANIDVLLVLLDPLLNDVEVVGLTQILQS